MKKTVVAVMGGSLFGVAVLVSACSKTTPSSGGADSAAVSAPRSLLAAGEPAPDVTFSLSNGEKLALSSLRGRPVIVYFYPKDDSPGCTVEAQEIRDLHEQMRGTGAAVIGVSTDPADAHRAFAEKHALPFSLASDTSRELAQAFGVPMKNGRATRVSFVIGADGRIKRVFPQVKPQGHAAELLAAIKS